MFWDICTSIAWLTKQPKLVPEISSKSVPFVPSRGDASKRKQTLPKYLSNWKVNLKRFSVVACVPTAWYKRDGFTGNVWYKLRLLSQPSNTRTNIPKHASGPISWLIPKCKQYKLRPPLILYYTYHDHASDRQGPKQRGKKSNDKIKSVRTYIQYPPDPISHVCTFTGKYISRKHFTYHPVQIFKIMFRRFLFSRIWSSAQDHALLVLLLNLVEFFISTRPLWSGGNVLYHSCTNFEGASRGGQPLNIFTWFIGAGGHIQIDHFKTKFHILNTLPTYKYIHFKTTFMCPRSIAGVPSGQALPGYLITAPPSVCVPERVPGLGQITWWIVCWQKMRGHLGKKLHGNREIVVKRAVGVWVHRDSWLGAQMGSVLEPNTNAQRMLLLSHLLRSAWYPLVPNCWSFLHSPQ